MRFFNLTYKGKPVFYGWIIVSGLAIMNMIVVNLLIVNYGLFINPISEELGIGKAIFGWGYTVELIGMAISGFIIGRILDIYGARRPLIIVALIIFVIMITMSVISNGWQMLAILMILGTLGLDPTGGSLYSMVPVSQWFIHKRGKAMSIVFLGLPIGIFFGMPLTQFLINKVGWRDTIIILGSVGASIILLVALLIRRRPEDMGSLPDGDSAGERRNRDKKPARDPEHEFKETGKAKYSWTRAEAIRNPAFWKLALATGFFMFATSTFGIFRVPYFVDLGFDPQMISFSLSMEATSSFLISYPLGYAMTRVPLRYLLIFSLLALVACIFMAMSTTTIWQIFLTQAFFGIAIQSRFIIEGTIWPSYFGEHNIGSIRGLAVPLNIAFGMAGAPIAGMVYDAYGSYAPAWWAGIVLLTVSILLLATTPKPAHRTCESKVM